MSRPKRTSALAGTILVLTLVVTPVAQAAGPALSLPASWLEIGLGRIAGWWEGVMTPRGVPAGGPIGAKISTSIDPNGASSNIGTGIDPNGDHSTAPPPANTSRDITGTIDPNG